MTTFPTLAASSTAGTSTNAGSLSITLPSGILEDDYILVIVGTEGVRTDATAPAGLTQLARNDTGHTSFVLGKVSDGSDSSTVHTVTYPTTATASAQVMVWRGVDPDTAPGLSTVATGVSTTPNSGSVTASWGSDNNLFVSLGNANDDASSVSSWPASYSYQQLSHSNGGGTNNNAMVFAAARQLAAATNDPGSFTINDSDAWSAWTVVLRPTPDPPPFEPPTTGGEPTGGYHVGDSSEVSFSSTVNGVDADISILVDWDGDGDFDEPEEDVTGLTIGQISTRTGRDSSSQLQGTASPGELKCRLLNTDGRFSQFNTDSPLKAGAFSTSNNSLVRLVRSGATMNDPVRIASDHFETGITKDLNGRSWAAQNGNGFLFQSQSQVRPAKRYTGAERSISTIDIGASDGLIIARWSGKGITDELGIVYRYQDANNYGLVVLAGDVSTQVHANLQHWTLDAGVFTKRSEVQTEDFEDCSIIVNVDGDAISYGLNNMYLASDEAAKNSSSTTWGLYAVWRGSVAPTFNEFHAWDRPYTENNDVIWTGKLSALKPSGSVNGLETAELRAEGYLADLARANIETVKHVGAASSVGHSLFTGMQVGNALIQSRNIEPPVPLEGDILYGVDHATNINALELCRKAESVELGRLYETNEGGIGFTSRSAASPSPTSGWSDDNSEQFQIEEVKIDDHMNNVVTVAKAQVGSVSPKLYSVDEVRSDWPAGAVAAVDIVNNRVPPEAAPGDLMLLIATTSVHLEGRSWTAPGGFTMIHNPGEEFGVPCVMAKTITQDDIDHVPDWRFYSDLEGGVSAGGGGYFLNILFIRDWFGSIPDGVKASVTSSTPTGSSQRQFSFPKIEAFNKGKPTLFIAAHTGVDGGAGGGSAPPITDDEMPHRYKLEHSLVTPSTPNSDDVGTTLCYRYGVGSVETPTDILEPLAGFQNLGGVTVGVRGYEGEAEGLGNGSRSVTATRDLGTEVGKVWNYRGAVFDSEEDATETNAAVLEKYSTPTPTLSMSFTASKSPAYRKQAIERRPGDTVYIKLTEGAGKGIEGVFNIQSVRHRLDAAGKHWVTTWGLGQ